MRNRDCNALKITACKALMLLASRVECEKIATRLIESFNKKTARAAQLKRYKMQLDVVFIFFLVPTNISLPFICKKSYFT